MKSCHLAIIHQEGIIAFKIDAGSIPVWLADGVGAPSYGLSSARTWPAVFFTPPYNPPSKEGGFFFIFIFEIIY